MRMSKEFTIVCEPENAAKLKGWIDTRGGLLLWGSQLLERGHLGRTWITPCIDEAGNPPAPPHWGAAGNSVLVTDPDDVAVELREELRRYGYRVPRCTLDKVWRKLNAEHPDSDVGYELKLESGEYVFTKRGKLVPLLQFLGEK